MRNLSVLRKNKRSDKSKSGKKQPRKYDILPAHASGSNEEDMQVEVHELMAHFASQEIPNVNEGLDAVIEDVIEECLLRLSEDEYVISKVYHLFSTCEGCHRISTCIIPTCEAYHLVSTWKACHLILITTFKDCHLILITTFKACHISTCNQET